MAEPLSFIASVIAVGSLAGNISSKGYKYLRAVKEAPQEVRRLFAEAEVLCGILNRLEVVLRRHKGVKPTHKLTFRLRNDPQHQQYQNHSTISDDDDSNSSVNSDLEEMDDHLEPPTFVVECKKTLFAIDAILNKFLVTSKNTSTTENSSSQMRLSKLRRMSENDLKWPLARSRTIELVEALERHKSTCTLAIAGDSLAGVHSVLENIEISNQYLRSIDERQRRIYKSYITSEQEKALSWLSSVNPYRKLDRFRRERQSGTGAWLFDLPEMKQWLSTSNTALWIYGIPGSGKTILSTLVVDKILRAQQPPSVGSAFFYVRYDDDSSHVILNILGSLISQLGYQNESVMEEIVQIYQKHCSFSQLLINPTDHKLLKLLYRSSLFFTDTYIMIDGIDECGSIFDDDRKCLIKSIASLHYKENGTIRTLIFSRDEPDIRISFQKLMSVAVAAISSDLKLYVHAWLPSLNIKSENLEVEIADTLVAKAKGMFMWVRAQIDYLQRLPTDKDKQDALQDLPPDLPQTYIRIFETIDSSYPEKTRKYIIRALKWLVFTSYEQSLDHLWSSSFLGPEFLAECLCYAVCIGEEEEMLNAEDIPTISDFRRWFGCLINVTPKAPDDGVTSYTNLRDEAANYNITFSHFTIREFLQMNPDKIENSTVRKYLIEDSDIRYLANASLNYLNNDQFKITSQCWKESCTSPSLSNQYPFYKWVSARLLSYIWDSEIHEDNHLIQNFLSTPTSLQFKMWSWNWPTEPAWGCKCRNNRTQPRIYMSPLHVAILLGFSNQVSRLLHAGVDPNTGGDIISVSATPLHIATIASYSANQVFFTDSTLSPVLLDMGSYIIFHGEDLLNQYTSDNSTGLEMVKMLTEFGANIDAPIVVDISLDRTWDGLAIVTPLVLAVLYDNFDVAEFLIAMGAVCKATSLEGVEFDGIRKPEGTLYTHKKGGRRLFGDIASLEDLSKLLAFPFVLEETLQELAHVSESKGLKEAMSRWQEGDEQTKEARDKRFAILRGVYDSAMDHLFKNYYDNLDFYDDFRTTWRKSLRSNEYLKSEEHLRSDEVMTWTLESLSEQGIKLVEIDDQDSSIEKF